MPDVRPGTAPIKSEYILCSAPVSIPDDDAAEGSTSHVGQHHFGDAEVAQEDGSGPRRNKKHSRDQKKAQRGANKGRRFGKVRDDLELCWRVANGTVCELGTSCRFTHDVSAYLLAKPRDIRMPPLSNITASPPFIDARADDNTMDEDTPNTSVAASLDPKTKCPVYEEAGWCRLGLKCRFLGDHAVITGPTEVNGEPAVVCPIALVEDDEKKAQAAVATTELNYVNAETLKLLRSHKYKRPITDAYMKELSEAKNEDEKEEPETPVETSQNGDGQDTSAATATNAERIIEQRSSDPVAATNPASLVDSPDARCRFAEKQRLHWKGKTYLAPLTTVGNLPFRRLCVDLGADITCGEMGLATSFLTASREEWSLVRRHPSEKTFGVQVAGNKPQTMGAVAEVLGNEFCSGEAGWGLDFVDVNCGCPIDLVFKTGSGSALLDTQAKLTRILTGMSRALGPVPVTAKLRTGVKDGKNNAHKLMPRLVAECGVGALTLHGRTRQQRYTKLADWDYIKQCVEAVREKEAEEGLSPIPIFGGGDCFSSEDYWTNVEHSGVDGIMVARGALIKPWIFTEIKERREWDISSRERLELIGKYAEYGLSHFGTDTAGVNTTRRYLCEALSFQHRYIPIGLLERLPGKINDRPPAFRGRDELETLLASTDSRDWVKISEMFLGPPPASWSFTPKHKSNAYNEENQG
ncbi:FMN-linked oxidoreductase [Coniophora puteana RWD-64-598 SS2]|uniref:tRNA-dihydrouridine(47) synthase [NAD(P)(+)] n=1 Tax=Coniophora puteana (strain RWD-64-598) TaxID=741705 RepID=A0A5M3MMQ3_CONPW|nr:FMN-linked oxidoreductase [Coniophora puteana RWD-64-598 SS2]EIW80054.1 FMN-linked oxidoreductase [Coniophora puteana RWD-64-598 SS2]